MGSKESVDGKWVPGRKEIRQEINPGRDDPCSSEMLQVLQGPAVE